MFSQTRKPAKEYWTYRLVAAMNCMFLLAGWSGSIYGGFVLRDNRAALLVISTLLFSVPLIVLALSLGAFPWQYSPLGKLRRTGFPVDAAIEVFPGQWAKIGSLHVSWLGANWLVFSTGLGLELSFGCKVYLPSSAMLGWEKRRLGYALHHDSTEMNSPLVMPVKVYEAVTRVMSQHNREVPLASVV